MATMYNFAVMKFKPFGNSERQVGYDIKGRWVSSKIEARKKAMKYAIAHAKPFKLTYPYSIHAENEVVIISNDTHISPAPYSYDGGVPQFKRVGAVFQSSWSGEWEFISYSKPTANVHYSIAFDGSIKRKD